MLIQEAITDLKRKMRENAARIDKLRAIEKAREKLVAQLAPNDRFLENNAYESEKTAYLKVKEDRIACEDKQHVMRIRLKELNQMRIGNDRIAAEERKRIARARYIGERIRKKELRNYERRCADEAFSRAEAMEV